MMSGAITPIQRYAVPYFLIVSLVVHPVQCFVICNTAQSVFNTCRPYGGQQNRPSAVEHRATMRHSRGRCGWAGVSAIGGFSGACSEGIERTSSCAFRRRCKVSPWKQCLYDAHLPLYCCVDSCTVSYCQLPRGSQ